MRDKGIQRKLLLQADLTFEKAMEVALAVEAAEKDSLCLTGATTEKPTECQAPPATQPAVYRVGPR